MRIVLQPNNISLVSFNIGVSRFRTWGEASSQSDEHWFRHAKSLFEVNRFMSRCGKFQHLVVSR